MQRIWTAAKDEELKVCYPHDTTSNVAYRIGMSIDAVETRARRLGLKKVGDYRQTLYRQHAERMAQANRKYSCNHAYFSEIDSHEKAYWLGWLWADGYVRMQNGSYQITLALQKSDEGILQQFRLALEATYPILPDRNAVRITLISQQMFSDLLRYGVVPQMSKLATYPCIKHTFVADFIRGVFDGDGHICVTKPHSVSVIGTELFCQWLAETTYHEIGIKSAIYHKKNSTYVWVVYTDERLMALAQWIYQPNKDGSLPDRLERKYARFIDYR